MKTAWIICRRELGAYFASPMAYIILAGFVAFTGFLFFNSFFTVKQARLDGLFHALPLVYLFFAPAMAMRLIAEERDLGTIELLLTMPVRDREVVLGKYLAALIMLMVALAATLPFAYTVSRLGDLDLGPVIGGYLGALLLGGLYLAAGLLASSVTREQVIAFIVGLILCFAVYALTWVVDAGTAGGGIVMYLSPAFHFGNLSRGYVELRSVVYFVSGIALFVLLAVQVLEARKWG
ncbi:MAG: ABC transporter [Deltaproteobacteria bacterium]|nr:MAG: ABC transporter [Deltaproteobacteria bacterium]